MIRRLALLAAAALSIAGCAGRGDAPDVPSTAASLSWKWLSTVTKTSEGGMRIGNPDAKVRLVEYGARTCPTCARFAAEAMKPLLETYVARGDVSFEFRDYLVHGTPDLPPALLNRCVAPRRFFPVLEQLFAAQSQFLDAFHAAAAADPAAAAAATADDSVAAVSGAASMFGYRGFASELGLKPERAEKCLADAEAIGAARASTDAAQAMGVRGTPSFFINDVRVEAYQWAALEPLIVAALGD